MNRFNCAGPVPRLTLWALLALWPSLSAALTLEQAIALAQEDDPWLQGSELRQQALQERSVAAGELPDPMLSLGFANLPTDTFDFDQEAMTQFRVGVSQVLPRGDSRELARRQLALQSEEMPHQREERRARVAVQVSQLWLEAYRAREAIRLIEGDRGLFEQLLQLARSNYSAALGGTRQQDIIRAQLELTRLDDRLAVLQQSYDAARAGLGLWLADAGAMEPAATAPDPELLQAELYRGSAAPTKQALAQLFATHPSMRGIESRIAAGETGVELARQSYKPQWQLNAAYGYRDDDPAGPDRADFFSVGVALDLPLFTADRQDRQVQSANASVEALRTERALALRRLVSGFEADRARLLQLRQRRELYRGQLLREMNQQSEASLAAYTSDQGDFAEVVRARIAELNARLELLTIEMEHHKAVSRLNYYFAGVDA